MTRPSPSPAAVLVVEDDPVHVEITRSHLSRLGERIGEVTVCGRLAPALEHAAAHDVDLVLLDMTLPDSDVEDTIGRIGELKAGGALVAALSALGTPEIADAAVRGGAAAFIEKGDLRADRIAELLDGAGAPRAEGEPETPASAPDESPLRRLASRIAHDANSWLTNQTFRVAAVANDAGLADETRQHLDSIRASSDALAALVEGARALIVDETEPVASESIDLAEWLAPFAEGWCDAAGRTDATIAPPSGAPSIAASPTGLAVVFEALFANATDPAGRAGASIELRAAPAPDDSVAFDVVDDGGAWSIDDPDRVADALVTGERGSTRAGLGLFRARRWMERMGGSLALVEREDAPGAYAVRLTFASA